MIPFSIRTNHGGVSISVHRLFCRLVIGWLFIAAACQPTSPDPQTQPTPEVIRIHISPALSWMSTYFNGCAVQVGGTAVVIEPNISGLGSPDPGVISFQWGEPDSTGNSGQALLWQTGWDDLVFIVHPDNPIKEMSYQDLQLILSSSNPHWKKGDGSDAATIQVYRYPENDEVQVVAEKYLHAPVKSTLSTALAPDPEAVRGLVAVDPTALGYLPRRWLDSSVRELKITGGTPQALHQAIIASAGQEPQGKARQWLSCIQGMMK